MFKRNIVPRSDKAMERNTNNFTLIAILFLQSKKAVKKIRENK